MLKARNHTTRSMASRLMAGLALLAILALPSGAGAQNSQSIVAVVDKSMISTRDLDDRTKLVLAASGLENTPRNRSRLRPRILEALIDEHLQLAEAERLGVQIPDGEIVAAKRRVETRNQMPEGAYDQFLSSNGIKRRTADAQLRASLAWNRVVLRRYSAVASVTAEEVDEGLAAFERNLGKPQYRVAEILLPVEDAQQQDKVRAAAERLVEEIRNGGDFNAIAREVSASASARAGGRLGWVAPGQLAPEIDAVIGTLEPNQVSDPIRTPSGYHIMLVEDRQILSESDPMLIRVRLKHILLPLSPEPSDAALKVARAIAESVASKAAGCDDMERLAEEVNSPVPADLGEFMLRDLLPAMRDEIASLPIGVASGPLRTADGLSVLMVCSRTEAPSNIPTRSDIEQQLRARKLESLAQRYLRDLRRDAFIETRL